MATGLTPKCHFVLGLLILQLWRPITACEDFQLRWGLKQSCSPRHDFSNGMSHATWKKVNQGDSWILVVGSQIGSLTPDLSFSHNLCFKYPNGSCERNLDICIQRSFQWYKKCFDAMNFDPCNPPLKIWKSIGSPTPKMRVHLGVWGVSFPHVFLHPQEHEMWLPSFILGPHFCKPLLWLRVKG